VNRGLSGVRPIPSLEMRRDRTPPERVDKFSFERGEECMIRRVGVIGNEDFNAQSFG